MRKALILLAALALLIWIITWFRTPQAVAKSGAVEWPGGLGPLGSVAGRLPPLGASDASVKLTALARALPASDAVDDFVGREISRADASIGQSPALPDVTAIRELLLREPIAWKREGGVSGVGEKETIAMRAVHMNVARALVADALAKGRWDDLQAVWNLARSLDPQPEMMMQTAALSMARMINAVAWKMPLPAPPWFAEVQQHDYVKRLLEAFQYQAASYWASGTEIFPTKSLADSVEHDRRIAEAVAKTNQCDVTVPMNDLGVDLASVWRRAFRYRAEREASANAIRVRESKPIEAKSQCSDGAWTFDGTQLRFSKEIATAPPDKPLPLTLRLKP